MSLLSRTVTLTRHIAPWLLRAAVIIVLLAQVAPPQARVTLGPPRQVQTAEDHVCVHTDLINEVDEWKIQRSLRLTREMGADTIVEFFPWSYFEPADGRYTWSQADRIVKHAENQGIRIIARMGLVPAWARPDDSTANTLPRESMPDFADFVAKFAARYAGQIDHLIIWNEPNLAFEWGFQDVGPAYYADLLETVYPDVKRANPDAVVLAGALAPTLEPEESPNGTNDLTYLSAMYAAGAAPYFDALAVHTYGFTHPPGDPAQADVLNFRRAELLREIMTRNSDGDKPVYITETGWNDDSRWTRAVSPARRIAFTLDAFRYADSNWPWVEEACLWILRHPTQRHNHRDGFTLVTPGFQQKPIYGAVRAYARDQEQSDQLWLPPPNDADEDGP